MKCICTAKCFIKHDGRTARFNPGQVIEFEECPTHFEELKENTPLDFLTSGEEKLLNTKWRLEDAKKAIKAAFGVTLTGKKKETIVKQILDARNRSVDTTTVVPAAQ